LCCRISECSVFARSCILSRRARSGTRLRTALQDFLADAEGGHADAAVSAGATMLYWGFGQIVPRNQERAFQLYQEAGELGSKEGWRNVVACYARGEGVPQSSASAKYIAKTMLSNDDDDGDNE
jgi:TPR repeat protein